MAFVAGKRDEGDGGNMELPYWLYGKSADINCTLLEEEVECESQDGKGRYPKESCIPRRIGTTMVHKSSKQYILVQGLKYRAWGWEEVVSMPKVPKKRS